MVFFVLVCGSGDGSDSARTGWSNECDCRGETETGCRSRRRRSKAGSLLHSLYSKAQREQVQLRSRRSWRLAERGLISLVQCEVAKSDGGDGEWRDRLEKDGILERVGRWMG